MCGNLGGRVAQRKTSEAVLGGYVTGLHAVQNTRTKERFLIGGADDGSIAFWTIECVHLNAMMSASLIYCLIVLSNCVLDGLSLRLPSLASYNSR